MDDHDDRGQPPYPLVKDLTKEEKEYVYTWLDKYFNQGPCVAYLAEFLIQQKSGHTDWFLPLT